MQYDTYIYFEIYFQSIVINLTNKDLIDPELSQIIDKKDTTTNKITNTVPRAFVC